MTKYSYNDKEKERLKLLQKYEEEARREGYKLIAGIDEAGRGSWAGPVVAAAVILPPGTFIPGIDDSKKLTLRERERLYDEIINKALDFSAGFSSVETIDKENILNATYMAMRESLKGLKIKPDMVLIDGRPVPSLGGFSQLSIVKGDGKSISIAAASIIAKVTRDRKMKDLSALYPEYGFHRNKGYGTKAHHEALKKYGVSPIHRKTFRPVRELLPGKEDNSWNLWNNIDDEIK